MKLLLAALALSAPATAPATVAPVAVPASQLDQLVLLLMPDQKMVELLGAGMRSGAQSVPELARDKALTAFVIARLTPELEKIMRPALPELRAEIAQIISAELTPAEIADVYAFFSSPTGAKLQATLYEVIAENPGLSEADIQRIGVERFTSRLTFDDYGPLSAFGASSGAPKMQVVNPRMSAASRAWAERLFAKNSERITALRTQAIADYRRQHPETAK